MESKITTVTVFTDRAAVTRSANVELSAGEHTLIFDNLPTKIDPDSIQVSGSKAISLRDVKFEKVFYSEIPDGYRKKLDENKLKTEDELRKVEDRIIHAKSEKNFVENITKKVTSVNDKQENDVELNPEKWIQMTDFYRNKLNSLDAEIHAAEIDRRTILANMNKIIREIKQLGKATEKSKNQVQIKIHSNADNTSNIHLTYIVRGPKWLPVYDLRVETDSKKMNITYHAIIQQNTTEDWNDVQIKLSTAQVSISGEQPKLKPWYIDIYTPNARPKMAKHMRMRTDEGIEHQKFASGAELDEEISIMEDVDQPLAAPPSEVETKSTSVVFHIDGKNTVKSDNRQQKVTIMHKGFQAHFRYSTIPKLSPYAYLKAEVKNITEFPFLAGKTNIFLDNNFVANARLETVAPTEKFWTFLGIDEGMKVEHKFLKKYQKDEGLFTKKTKLVYEYMIKITNHKKNQEEIVVWDQIPISGNSDIEVSLLEPKYKEDSDALKMNEHSFIEWFFKPEAGKTIEIPFKFLIEYPNNLQITGLD